MRSFSQLTGRYPELFFKCTLEVLWIFIFLHIGSGGVDGIEICWRYSFYHRKGEKGLTIAKSSIAKYTSKVRVITSGSKPYAMYKRYEMLRQLNWGWTQYFKLNEAKSLFVALVEWTRRRIRLCYWKQWKLPSTRVKKLAELGTPKWQAHQWGNTRKGYWRISNSSILQRALNNSLLKREGYLPLTELSTLPTKLF